MYNKKQKDVIQDITEQTLLTLDGVAEEISKQTVQEEVDNFIAERTLKENPDEVMAIANKVKEYKKGDKTNFGVVVAVSPSSITFKSKDVPNDPGGIGTKIVFNARKMGSKDYVLSSLSKINESMYEYSNTMEDDEEVEVEEETIESLAAKLELTDEQVETLAAKCNEKYGDEECDAVLLDMLKIVAIPTDEEHKSAMMELIVNGDFDALEAHIAEMKAKEESNMNEDSSYLDKLKKLNPGWDPEKAKGDFQNEYDPEDPKDAKDHADYLANAAEFIDNLSSFTPGVKIGDFVEAYVKNSPVASKMGIGKIIRETTLKGHDYGYSGYKGPSTIPAWTVKVFVEDVNDDYEEKEPNDYILYNGKTYMNIGMAVYAQHDEIQSNKSVEKYKTYTKADTFKRLANQNVKIETIDRFPSLRSGREESTEQSDMKIDTTDIDELVKEEEGLTEGFKEKASIIFEAAVASKVKATKSLLKEQYAIKLQEEVETIKETLVEKIDLYLTYAVETWVEDNKVAVESTLRTEITESFIGSLKNIFTEHYIEVPESKVNFVANMEAQLSSLKEQVDKKGRIANALADRVEKLTRQKVIAEASTGLADTQIAKLTELVQDVEFINENTFAKKVGTIREFYINNRNLKHTLNENVDDNASFISKETIVENSIEGDSVSPSMQNYLSAMSRMNKATTANLVM